MAACVELRERVGRLESSARVMKFSNTGLRQRASRAPGTLQRHSCPSLSRLAQRRLVKMKQGPARARSASPGAAQPLRSVRYYRSCGVCQLRSTEISASQLGCGTLSGPHASCKHLSIPCHETVQPCSGLSRGILHSINRQQTASAALAIATVALKYWSDSMKVSGQHTQLSSGP